MHGRHKLVARMFMSISQKIRRLESGLFDENYYNMLIYALNDQMETILTAGENPSDEDYRMAHERMKSIIDSEMRATRSSFIPGMDRETVSSFFDGFSVDKDSKSEENVQVEVKTIYYWLSSPFKFIFSAMRKMCRG